MLRGKAALSVTPNALREAFRKTLLSLWRAGGSRPQLGLAISGGVDSMALASLCAESVQTNAHGPSFIGFIVDHQLRKGSTKEASDVAIALRRLQIQPRVLTVDWAQHGDPSSLTNLESVARRLRYQALGNACREHDLTSLLVAHHADDQAETVMMRLLGGYIGFGLRGMKSDRHIPYCDGLYGINRSGSPHHLYQDTTSAPQRLKPRIGIEGGGVRILRPLLPFTKDQLVAHCNANGVTWFDDHTNFDRTYTPRNTVRHLLRSDNMPVAMRKPRLLALAATVASEETSAVRLAQDAFEQSTIRLDTSAGRAVVHLPTLHPLLAAAPQEAYAVKAILLRRLLELVTPMDDVPLQDLHDSITFIFRASARNASKTPIQPPAKACQIAGVAIAPGEQTSNSTGFILQRRPPSLKETAAHHELHIATQPVQDGNIGSWWASDWLLWDNRYWLRVLSLDNRSLAANDMRVQFLTMTHLAALRKSLDHSRVERLNRLLEAAPGSTRLTIPAIISQSVSPSDSSAVMAEQVVALPTVDWSTDGWSPWPASHRMPGTLYWEVRYKDIDFNVSETHSLVARGTESRLLHTPSKKFP